MIDLDDQITNYVMTNLDVFKDIHPNVITIVGIILNYFILLEVKKVNTEYINPIKLGLLMFFRCLADCIDGAVARKYNKTSDLGNKLDTISDILFAFVILYFFMVKFNIGNWIVILFILLIIFINNKYSVFTTHEIIKNSDGGMMNYFFKFATRNTIIIFAGLYAIILLSNNVQ